MWNGLLILFAGSYSQAYASRRSLTRTLFSSGDLDRKEAATAIAWLVRRDYVRDRKEALDRVHQETVVFLLLRWDAIERVAAGLLKAGRLSSRQVRALAQTAYRRPDGQVRRNAQLRAGGSPFTKRNTRRRRVSVHV